MTEGLPRGLAIDVDAFERSEAEFEAHHGREARERWAALGAQRCGPLDELQFEVMDRNGVDSAQWNAFAWEIERRVELLEDARTELRRGLRP